MELLLVLALLACPVSMGAMMWWMGRNTKNPSNQLPGQPADLRDRRAALEAQIAEVERAQRGRAA